MDPVIAKLIDKYLQGTATAAESILVEQYYQLLNQKGKGAPGLTEQEKKELEEKLFNTILQKIKPGVDIVKPEKSTIRMWPAVLFKLAAAFIGLLIVAVSYKFFLQADPVILSTGNGQVATFTLPDSSKVTLNGNSVLKYTPWNNTENREVTLQGEAYFSVTHTRNHQKFLVNVPGKMQVEVLGTEFNVTGRRNNSRVVLTSGKVRLHIPASAQEVTMKPGEMVELTPESAKIEKSKVNPEKYSSWSRRLLVLDKTKLSELVEILESAYGLQVTVSDTSLLKHTFSGKLPRQDVDMLLLGLSKSFDLKIVRNHNQIKITK